MAISDEEEKEATEAVTSALETIVSRSLKNWVRLSWYRTSVLEGLPQGETAARQAFSSYRAKITGQSGNTGEAPARLSFAWWLAEADAHLASMEMGRARSFLDASSVVFAHSILDASVTDLCRLAMGAQPRKTAELLEGRTFPLKRIKGAKYYDLLGEAIRKQEEDLEGFPLVKRIGFLLKNYCPAHPDLSVDLHGYTFDLDRVSRFDQLRHDIVHKEWPDLHPDETRAELEFIQSTDIYLYLRFRENFFHSEPPGEPPQARNK